MTAREGRTIVVPAFLLLASSLGSAALEVEWIAPHPECPDHESLEQEILHLLAPVRATATLRVRIETRQLPAGASWFGTVTSTTARGVDARTLRASSCAELMEAAAVIVAMAIVNEGGSSTNPVAEVQPLEAPAPNPTPSQRPNQPTAIAPDVPSIEPRLEPDETSDLPSSLGLLLRLQSSLERGQLPNLGPGIGFHVGLHAERGPRLRVEVGGRLRVAQQRLVRSEPDAGGRFGLLGLEAQVCAFPVQLQAWLLGACFGGELGFLSAAGFGVTNPASSVEVIPAVLAEVRASYALSSGLSVVLSLGPILPLTRPVFLLEPAGPIHQASALGARASVGLEVGIF